jgi:hypothetical protein
MIFKRMLGWLILSSMGIGLYVAISLSMPEIYSFPVEGVFGWMIPISRWLVVPFVIGMIALFFFFLFGLSLLLSWCFNGSWKEARKHTLFGFLDD